MLQSAQGGSNFPGGNHLEGGASNEMCFHIYPSNLTHSSSALLLLSYSTPHILVISCFLFGEKTSSFSSELQKQPFNCSKQIFVLKN